jgi:hypothetical protein
VRSRFKTVLIQDRSRKWYKATLFGYCTDLPFAERLAFESNSDGSVSYPPVENSGYSVMPPSTKMLAPVM